MDEATIRKAEIAKNMTAVPLTPLELNHEITVQNGVRIPVSELTTLGMGLDSLSSAVQQVVSRGKAVSGYYKVTVPAGTELAKFKDGSGFLGTALNENGIVGQARLNPVLCNPALLFAAAALANMNQKLDAISDMQQEMIEFLTQKEKSALRGSLDFLYDVYQNYKYNWKDEKYKTANHVKALDIRQSATQMIDFYRAQIQTHTGGRKLLHTDRDARTQAERVAEDFKEYQLALYLYGFSRFLEILLQENFESAYLESVTQKMDELSFQYRTLYTEAFDQAEDAARTSLQSRLFSGLATASKKAGESVSQISAIRKSQLDRNLAEAGRKLEVRHNHQVKRSLSSLSDYRNGCIHPFIEQIRTVSELYNQPLSLVFNGDTLYIAAEKSENEA